MLQFFSHIISVKYILLCNYSTAFISYLSHGLWLSSKLPYLLKLKLWCSYKVGSIEGRVGVHHLDDAQQGKNFTFKCHREGNEIYAVNSLNFHPVRFFNATAVASWHFSLIISRLKSTYMMQMLLSLCNSIFLNWRVWSSECLLCFSLCS